MYVTLCALHARALPRREAHPQFRSQFSSLPDMLFPRAVLRGAAVTSSRRLLAELRRSGALPALLLQIRDVRHSILEGVFAPRTLMMLQSLIPPRRKHSFLL